LKNIYYSGTEAQWNKIKPYFESNPKVYFNNAGLESADTSQSEWSTLIQSLF